LSRGFPYIAVPRECVAASASLEFARGGYCLRGFGGGLEVVRGCSGGCALCLVEVPYEAAGDIILDRVGGRVRCGFLIMWEGSGDGLYVRGGSEAYILEAVGRRIHSLVSEGDEVVRGSRVAYIYTGKGEVRVLRSDVEGVVAYISHELGSKPEKLLFIVVGGGNVSRVRIL